MKAYMQKKYWADDKVRIARREYYRKNRDRIFKWRMVGRYGITGEQYDQMIIGQNGLCAICEFPMRGKQQFLGIDHDHKTGKIRGLLCDLCNRGLGYFLDKPEWFDRAAAYLRANS